MSRRNEVNRCPETYRNFIEALAHDTPVCALLTNDDATYSLISQLGPGHGLNPKDDPQKLAFLQTNAPFIFDLVSSLDNEPIPDFIQPIFPAIIEKCHNSFISSSNNNIHHLAPSSSSQDLPTAFYPCLPPLVERGSYIKDDVRIQSELVVSNISPTIFYNVAPSRWMLKCLFFGEFLLWNIVLQWSLHTSLCYIYRSIRVINDPVPEVAIIPWCLEFLLFFVNMVTMPSLFFCNIPKL